MKKVILMVLAVMSMCVVSCEKDDEGKQENSFVSMRSDSTVVRAGDTIPVVLSLTNFPENRMDLSVKFEVAETDYDGKVIVEGATFDLSRDFASFMFGGDTLKFRFLTNAEKIPEGGKLALVAKVGSKNGLVQDTLWITVRTPKALVIDKERLKCKFGSKFEFNLKLVDEYPSPEDSYVLYAFVIDDGQLYGEHTFVPISANSDIPFKYEPKTIGDHHLMFVVTDQNGKQYSLFLTLECIPELKVSWKSASSNLSSTGILTIKAKNEDYANEEFILNVSEESDRGIFMTYETDDRRNIKLKDGSTYLRSTIEIERGEHKFGIDAINADPSKVHKLTVIVFDNYGPENDKRFDFYISLVQ